MEGEIEQKQNYLRMNILEKGYDAEQFMTFLNSKKGELGLDLNNWALNELISAVQEFISLNSPNNIQNNNQNINPEKQINEEEDNIENNTNNLEQMDIEHNPNQKNYQEEYIHCEKVEPNELSQIKDADIKISFPKKVEGGLFSK